MANAVTVPERTLPMLAIAFTEQSMVDRGGPVDHVPPPIQQPLRRGQAHGGVARGAQILSA